MRSAAGPAHLRLTCCLRSKVMDSRLPPWRTRLVASQAQPLARLVRADVPLEGAHGHVRLEHNALAHRRNVLRSHETPLDFHECVR